MDYLKAFLVGGAICALVQILMDKTKLMHGRIKMCIRDRDDDVILPPTYKENTGWQSIINIGIGLILGAVMIFFLVMPARERSLNYEHNQEMLSYTDQLNLANKDVYKRKQWDCNLK